MESKKVVGCCSLWQDKNILKKQKLTNTSAYRICSMLWSELQIMDKDLERSLKAVKTAYLTWGIMLSHLQYIPNVLNWIIADDTVID